MKPMLPPLPTILAAIEAQKKSEQWVKDGGQYIPHPATWLNQGRWDDQVTEYKERPAQQRQLSVNDYRTTIDSCKRGMERIQGTAQWQDNPGLVKEYKELRTNKMAADAAIARAK